MKKNGNSAALWIGVVVVISAILFGVYQLSIADRGEGVNLDVPLLTELAPQDVIKGPEDAAVTIVEYSDFQCPACRSYFPVMKQLEAEFGDDIRIVYRHFPLRNIHPHAQLAAQAAEAAGKQGKFWEMHDMLFEQQPDWSGLASVRPIFIDFAEQLSLDTDQFRTDLTSREVKEKVDKDYSSGTRFGVQGTPSFFVNGQRIVNPQGYEPFAQIVSALLPADDGNEGTTEGETDGTQTSQE